MSLNEHQALAVGVLFVVGVLLLAFNFAPWRGGLTPEALPPELVDEPDLYMEEAKITQFKDDGSIQYRLSAKEIRHFEDEQFTRLLAPNLELHTESGPPWQVRSALGEIHGSAGTAGGERVLLRDTVVAHQQGDGGDYISIHCEALNLYPERKYAETPGNVMIDTNVGRTLARGMQANLTTGSMRLSSESDSLVHTIVRREQFGHEASSN